MLKLLYLLGVGASLVTASVRIRETPLKLPGLNLESVSPVDPDGEHGPKRTAGYFKLNRTSVRCSHFRYLNMNVRPHVVTTDPLRQARTFQTIDTYDEKFNSLCGKFPFES